MKNFKFLFLSLLLVAFLAPNVVNAQAVVDVPVWCNVDGIQAVEATVLISASGNLQLKATFDLSVLNLDVKKKGVIKYTVSRLAVQVDPGGDPDYHFQAFYVKVKVYPDGMASVVYNWQIEDEY